MNRLNHSGQRGSALKATLIVLGVIAFFIAIVVAGAMFGWNRVTQDLESGDEGGFFQALLTNEDQPRIDATIARHQSIIDSIDQIVSSEDSKFQVAAKLEKLDLPQDVLYLALSREVENSFDPEVTEILRRLDWSGHSISTVNGTGVGTLSAASVDQDVIVFKRSLDNRPFADEWVMYIVDPGPEISSPVQGE